MIRLQHVTKSFGTQRVLTNLSLEIPNGENLVIIGRSGTGKSVTLKLILGLLHPDSGDIFVDNYHVNTLSEEELAPMRRNLGMVFQNGALFDSMTVGDNVAFPLREDKKLSPSEIRDEVHHALSLVGLANAEMKMPSEISGGMRKRVALARALVRKPKIMMYDEPTAGLDPILSDSISRLIKDVADQFNMTVVVVTHDMASAYLIADRIALLHQGQIYKIASPEEIRQSTDPILYNFVRGISTNQDL
ncbi:MAG: ABC transporter ATP-binding protein [Methylacidiphilales bacterium]|nr:ABC transporter ATP-binding protein [Candidatus Methylacidiphilales bacterium]MDW8349482.1 ABC transporter ATP-binding protein [Verrucomicrobiae bacterium]